MAHEQFDRDEAHREEIERKARLLREVERNLKDVRLEFRKQSFCL
jgi:hypothetical protein